MPCVCVYLSVRVCVTRFFFLRRPPASLNLLQGQTLPYTPASCFVFCLTTHSSLVAEGHSCRPLAEAMRALPSCSFPSALSPASALIRPSPTPVQLQSTQRMLRMRSLIPSPRKVWPLWAPTKDLLSVYPPLTRPSILPLFSSAAWAHPLTSGF